MPTVYPYTIERPSATATYLHMAKRDAMLWRRYLMAHGDEYIGFSYDVALGGIKIDAKGEDPALLLGYQYSTALKIDAVGWKGNQAWIIEVRPDAYVSAVGAVICYTQVMQRELVTELVLVPAIVCETIHGDVEWVCAKLGIQVIRA